MGISRSNFRFAGSYTAVGDGTTEGVRRTMLKMGHANGGGEVTGNGGEAAFGSVVPHSFLNGTAPAAAGDYCLGYMWGYGSQDSNNNYTRQGLLAAFVTTGSDSGSDFPVDASPAGGTLIAYSVRAFLRIDEMNGSVSAYANSQAAEIGLFVKGIGPGTNEQGDYNPSPTGSLSASYMSDTAEDATDPFYGRGESYNPRMSGYCLMLGNMRHDDDGAQNTYALKGQTGNVRLKFGAHQVNDISHTVNDGVSSYHETVFSGSANTWYHVRMDVTPSIGSDKVEIYSAPIANALGSESWTKHTTITIASSDEWYRAWDSTGSTLKSLDCGFYTSATKTHAADYLMNNVFIDGFEFFTKDVS
jgi:hypothetical protein